MAFRPRSRASSISSRYGSQALAVGARLARGGHGEGARSPGGSAARSVDTSLAGFARSVDTGLAAFGGGRRWRGSPLAIPAALRYALAVSRRTPVACSMRRSGHPSRPRARTWCFFSSPKRLAIPAGEHSPGRRVNVLGCRYLTGRFSGVHDWPVLGVRRGSHIVGFSVLI